LKVKILYFSSIKDKIKKREEILEIPENTTVYQLVKILEKKYPDISDPLHTVMIAVNEEYVDNETELKEGDIIAIIPPVSGG